MSKLDQCIAKRSKKSANFAEEYKKENQQLQVAVRRDKLGLTQRKFANLVGKPQSIIVRIESGEMNFQLTS